MNNHEHKSAQWLVSNHVSTRKVVTNLASYTCTSWWPVISECKYVKYCLVEITWFITNRRQSGVLIYSSTLWLLSPESLCARRNSVPFLLTFTVSSLIRRTVRKHNDGDENMELPTSFYSFRPRITALLAETKSHYSAVAKAKFFLRTSR
jgi:hypothetical protein